MWFVVETSTVIGIVLFVYYILLGYVNTAPRMDSESTVKAQRVKLDANPLILKPSITSLIKLYKGTQKGEALYNQTTFI